MRARTYEQARARVEEFKETWGSPYSMYNYFIHLRSFKHTDTIRCLEVQSMNYRAAMYMEKVTDI